ncbi:hypothetical protein AAULR_16474 [Lacticaseibacillus rhamnosus MTCC 5462]|nr:hypothetical protein AAULR_16474 [Lacticaseibacillus rhamnosus MTCC 5462]
MLISCYNTLCKKEKAQQYQCQQVNKHDTKVLPERLGVLFVEREQGRLETGV